jgi:TolA-binding protein
VIHRVAPLLLACVAPFTVAAMQVDGAAPSPAGARPAVIKPDVIKPDVIRNVETVHNQTAQQAENLKQLEQRLQTLERQDKQTVQTLKEKDRVIDALQRQLRQATPSAPRSVASSQGT